MSIPSKHSNWTDYGQSFSLRLPGWPAMVSPALPSAVGNTPAVQLVSCAEPGRASEMRTRTARPKGAHPRKCPEKYPSNPSKSQVERIQKVFFPNKRKKTARERTHGYQPMGQSVSKPLLSTLDVSHRKIMAFGTSPIDITSQLFVGSAKIWTYPQSTRINPANMWKKWLSLYDANKNICI